MKYPLHLKEPVWKYSILKYAYWLQQNSAAKFFLEAEYEYFLFFLINFAFFHKSYKNVAIWATKGYHTNMFKNKRISNGNIKSIYFKCNSIIDQ